MAEHALPDLISNIKVNSSGVDTAMMNLVTSFGKANLALAGVGVGIGALIAGGRSMIEISEKHDEAERGLAQAVDAYNDSIGKTVVLDQHAGEARAKAADVAAKANDSLTIATNATKLAQLAYTDAVKKHGVHSEDAYKASLHLQDANIHLAQAQDAAKDSQLALTAATTEANVKVARTPILLDQLRNHIEDFIQANRRFISDQAEVVSGFAKLTRAGLTQNEVQLDMNRALDLAALKHISVGEAVDLLIKAEQGRMKGLIDLGITTGKYTDAQGNLVNGTKDVSKAMAELDDKTKKGRESTTELHQAQNTLSNDWQDMANRGGPSLVGALDSIVQKVDEIYQAFDRIGKDDKLWSQISDRLVNMGTWIHNYLLSPLGQVGQYISGAPQGQIPTGQAPPRKVPGERAAGGPVLPGSIYTVGERGPETLVMGSSGGRVIPNAGAASGSAGNVYHVTLNVGGSVQTERGLLLAFREGLRQLDREQR
jgi:hypothetical protein